MNAQSRWLDSIKEKFEARPRLLENLPSIAFLLLTICYLVSLLLVITPRYWINDDWAALNGIKNGFTAYPVSHILGKVLSFLYVEVSDSVPWYGISIYISLGAALFVILRLLLAERSTKHIMIAAAISMFYAQFIQKVGFSSVAIICGGAGVIGILAASYRDEIHWYTASGYGLMLCLCFLWRPQALVFVVVFLFPLLVMKIRKYWFHYGLFILACILLYACNAFVSHFRVTPEQKHYEEFFYYHNYPNDFFFGTLYQLNKENSVLLQDVGWTENDFFICARLLYIDEDKYNIQAAKRILSHPNFVRPTKLAILGQLRRVLRSGLSIMRGYKTWTITTTIMLFLILLYCNRRQLLISLAFVGYTMTGAAFLGAVARYPPRLAEPMFFTITCFLAFQLLGKDVTESVRYRPESLSVNWTKLRMAILATGLIFLAFLHIGTLVHDSRLNENNRAVMHNIVGKIESMGPNSVFLTQAGVVHDAFNYRHPLRVYREKSISIPTGWLIFSPLFYSTIREIGLERGSEIFPYFVNSENAFIVCWEDMVEPLFLFIEETYRIETKFRFVATLPRLLDRNWNESRPVNIYKIEEQL